jgi:hypothetical protein
MAIKTKFVHLLEYYEAGKWGAEDIKTNMDLHHG